MPYVFDDEPDYLTQLVPDANAKEAPASKRYVMDNSQPEIFASPSIGRTVLDQSMQGATFGFGDEISDRIGALIAAKYTGLPYEELLKEARDASKARMDTEFRESPATSIAANIAGGLLTGGMGLETGAGKAFANSLRSGSTASRVGKTSLAGAASGGLYGAGSADDGNMAEGATTGAIVGGTLPLAVGAGAGIKNAITPTIQEGLLPVVELAKKYKIPVSLSQVSDSKAIKNIEKISKQLPFSGDSGFKNNQQAAFNRALISTVGGNATKFTPELMDNLFTKVGKEFDNLGKGKIFDLNGEFLDNVANIAADAEKVATGDATKRFDKTLTDIFSNISDSGQISGEKLGKIRANVNRLARKANDADTKDLLHDLENSIVDVMTAGDDIASGAFSKTKQKYKNLLVIEPLANKSKGGNISPSQLKDRVAKIYGRQFTRGQAGEIGDLARIGHELLPEIDGSDTVQKAILAGGIGSAALNPMMAIANAGKASALLGGNRAYQSFINRNQSIVNSAANKTQKKLKLTVRPQDELPKVNLPIIGE